MNDRKYHMRKLAIPTLFAVWVGIACLPAGAVVVISDGFGDADINNNGVPFEPVDTNIQGSRFNFNYRPGRLDQPGDYNGDGLVNPGDYAVWRDYLGSPDDGNIDDQGDGIDGVTTGDYAVWKSNFGASVANQEISAPALDPGDTGVRWIQMRGFSSAVQSNVPGTGRSKPFMRIVDDSQGSMRETSASGPGALGITAIDDGYALAWESVGGGSSAAGFFDQTIALGPQVDDEVVVSFDFRIWRDAPNQNGTLVNNEPLQGELRFGLYQDTDNQLGMSNAFAGRQVDENGDPLPDLNNSATPSDFTDSFRSAIWGQEEGLFDGSLTGQHGAGDEIGTNGDNGWQASIFMGNALQPDGGSSRIREEVQSDRILQGNDVQTIAQPENVCTTCGPFDPGEYDFINLDLSKVYNIQMSLKRATENTEADTIFAEVTVTDKATQETWSFGGRRQL